MYTKYVSSKRADVKSVLKRKPLVRAIALALMAGCVAVPAGAWAATIQGSKFVDINYNGIKDRGEGLTGETINLKSTKAPASIKPYGRTTDATGNFAFNSVAVGTYKIWEPATQPSGTVTSFNSEANAQIVTVTDSTQTVEVQFPAPLPPNSPPVITFNTTGPLDVNAGDSVTFEATLTDPNSWDTHQVYFSSDDGWWTGPIDLAAGSPATVTATHAFSGGTFNVYVQAMDNQWAWSDYSSVTVNVTGPANSNPTVQINNVQVDSCPETPAQFEISYSDPDTWQTPLHAYLDFGDGNWGAVNADGTTSTNWPGTGIANPSVITTPHTYLAAGIYSVYVNIWDDRNGWAWTQTVVTVGGYCNLLPPNEDQQAFNDAQQQANDICAHPDIVLPDNGGTLSGNHSGEVVKISEGNTVTLPASVTVKALCNYGTLQSEPGTDSLITATDLIANYSTGIIKGAVGSDGGDNGGQGSAIIMDSYTAGTGTTSNDCSGLIFNAGTIQAGQGGNAYLQGGNGGALTVNACEIMQAGFMVAGGGGNADAYGHYWCQDVYGGQGGETVLGADQTLFATPQSVTSSGFGGNARVWKNSTCNSVAHPGAGGNLSAWVLGGLYWEGTANSGGSLYIEPDIMLSGEGTHLVAKEDIVIFGGKDWELHLNNLRPEAINAGRNIIIAVGEGGIVDLKGNSSKVFKAAGTVEIYADTIMLDDGVKLEDLIEAKEITVKPSKILYHATLNGKQQVKGSVGTTLPVEFNLANGGPQQDTYTLNVTSASGWNMSTLPATVTVAGLTQEKLVLETTLPATVGEEGTITVTATSQTDPTVVATMTAHITTVAEEIKDDQKDEEDENPVPSITLTKTGDGNGSVQSRPAGIRCGKTCDKEFPENTTVKLVAFANKGSIFTGWGGDCNGTTKKTIVTVDNALTCTANFDVTKPAPDGMYNLTVKVEGEGDGVVTANGINCAGDCQQNHKRGKSLVLKATPDASSTFVGWSGDCEGMKSPLQVKLDQDLTCVATFQSK